MIDVVFAVEVRDIVVVIVGGVAVVAKVQVVVARHFDVERRHLRNDVSVVILLSYLYHSTSIDIFRKPLFFGKKNS